MTKKRKYYFAVVGFYSSSWWLPRSLQQCSASINSSSTTMFSSTSCCYYYSDISLLDNWGGLLYIHFISIMSSGFGIHGGVSRCFEHYQDINRCIVSTTEINTPPISFNYADICNKLSESQSLLFHALACPFVCVCVYVCPSAVLSFVIALPCQIHHSS